MNRNRKETSSQAREATLLLTVARKAARAAQRAADRRRGEGFDLPGGRPAIRHRSGTSSTGALPSGTVTIEEVVKDNAKGGVVKKARGGPVKKANRKNHRGCGAVMKNRRKKTLYT